MNEDTRVTRAIIRESSLIENSLKFTTPDQRERILGKLAEINAIVNE